MTTTHDAITPATPSDGTLWPPPAVHADADLSDADWGAVNRELLAEKLYLAGYPVSTVETNLRDIQPLAERPQWEQEMWLRAADIAITEILGAPNA